jgi:hypothetical protein
LDTARATALTVLGIATARGFLHEVTFGNTGTPADFTSLYKVERVTTAGTSTPLTPSLGDLADGAARCIAGVNHSAEPSYTASEDQISIPLHFRGAYRWVANVGDEIVIPATANAGLGFNTLHPTQTTDFAFQARWTE